MNPASAPLGVYFHNQLPEILILQLAGPTQGSFTVVRPLGEPGEFRKEDIFTT